MRKKNEPKKRGRAATQQGGPGGGDGGDGDNGSGAEQQQEQEQEQEQRSGATLSRRGSKRQRIGAAPAVDSVRCAACDDADLLGFADVLFAAPASAAAAAAADDIGGGADVDAAATAAADAAPGSVTLALAPGASDRLLLSWDAAALGGPGEAPVRVVAPSERAARALLQLLHAGRLGVCLKRLAWPAAGQPRGVGVGVGGGGGGDGANSSISKAVPPELPRAVVYGSAAAPRAELADSCDVVAPPRWRRRPPPGADSGGEAGQQEGEEDDNEAAGTSTGAEAGPDAAAGGLPDPGAALRPSRLVSYLAGAVAPRLAGDGDDSGDGEGDSSDGNGSDAGLLPPDGLQLWRLRVGLTRAAFQQPPAGAQDPVRRPWQAALMAVAAWLAPHWQLAWADDDAGGSVGEEGAEGGAAADAAAAAAAAGTSAGAGGAGGSGSGSVQAQQRRQRQEQQQQEEAAGAAGAGEGEGFDAAGRVYSYAKPTGLEPALAAAEAPPELLPKLRPYQARAVRWMLQRERAPAQPAGLVGGGGGDDSSDGDDDGGAGGSGAATPPLHPLWRAVRALPGGFARRLYVNAFSGLAGLERFGAPAPVRGGVAADEMGLGKTVELLALVLANR